LYFQFIISGSQGHWPSPSRTHQAICGRLWSRPVASSTTKVSWLPHPRLCLSLGTNCFPQDPGTWLTGIFFLQFNKNKYVTLCIIEKKRKDFFLHVLNCINYILPGRIRKSTWARQTYSKTFCSHLTIKIFF